MSEAGAGAAGIPYAQLIIPGGLEGPSQPVAGIEERRRDTGELEIVFVINFVPYAGTPEYQAYVQKMLEELRDRTIESCGGK